VCVFVFSVRTVSETDGRISGWQNGEMDELVGWLRQFVFFSYITLFFLIYCFTPSLFFLLASSLCFCIQTVCFCPCVLVV